MCIICENLNKEQRTCNGCGQIFCLTHLIDHQHSIDEQMNDLKKSYQDLKSTWKDNHYQEYFHQIDQWKNKSIEKIQNNAVVAKANLEKLIQQSKDYYNTFIDKISEQIEKSKETKNFSEIQIKQWKQQLNNLQLEYQEHFYIQIEDFEQISLIKITQKRKQHVDEHEQMNKKIKIKLNHDRFDKILGNGEYFENNLLVESHIEMRSIISGRNLYFNEKHSLQFQIEDVFRTGWTCFFGLMTSKEVLKLYVDQMNSVHGFWSSGYVVRNGKRSGCCRERRWIQGDYVTMIIDCQHRLIHLENKRNDWHEEIPIDIQSCRLPWKFLTIIKGCRLRLIHNSS
ncbi:unnamed protein product [Adineta steineri]|uniref:B box-type domain-containing protein n=1 Tax=Adineta steineri TaxID=433720 RepID=A0A815RBL2_9BILA|nr:unnamed protein product [Adineta steineri]CAF1475267.1 unnamed protein product [Adineta steineri]CAF4167534.1 unnamed protein product [Adineta steineri]CAF4170635.1 unnamed protein product [Adineta steineri]